MAKNTEETSVVAEGAAEAEAQETPAVPMERRIRVTIKSGSTKAEKSDVVLTINGDNVQIKRDKEVLLTPAQFECLENAESRAYTLMEGGRLKSIPGAKAHNYVVHGEVDIPVGSLDTTPVEVSDAAS